MSRSNPNEDVRLTNPAKFFLEWKGKDGGFEYWDKPTKSNIPMPLPFTFIPLCICTTLKGYNQKKDISFWSNEVRDIQKEKFTIRGRQGKSGTIETYFEGLYKDLKDKLELNKINYITSLYIAYKDDKKVLQLGNIQIKTSALKPWIEFSQKVNVMECAVQVKTFTKEKTGDVEFVSPVYTAVKIGPDTEKEAIALDVKLQEYLKAYFAKNAENISAVTTNSLLDAKTEAKVEAKIEEKVAPIVQALPDDFEESAPF